MCPRNVIRFQGLFDAILEGSTNVNPLRCSLLIWLFVLSAPFALGQSSEPSASSATPLPTAHDEVESSPAMQKPEQPSPSHVFSSTPEATTSQVSTVDGPTSPISPPATTTDNAEAAMTPARSATLSAAPNT